MSHCLLKPHMTHKYEAAHIYSLEAVTSTDFFVTIPTAAQALDCRELISFNGKGRVIGLYFLREHLPKIKLPTDY